jgi:hypothetical protein
MGAPPSTAVPYINIVIPDNFLFDAQQRKKIDPESRLV